MHSTHARRGAGRARRYACPPMLGELLVAGGDPTDGVARADLDLLAKLCVLGDWDSVGQRLLVGLLLDRAEAIVARLAGLPGGALALTAFEHATVRRAFWASEIANDDVVAARFLAAVPSAVRAAAEATRTRIRSAYPGGLGEVAGETSEVAE